MWLHRATSEEPVVYHLLTSALYQNKSRTKSTCGVRVRRSTPTPHREPRNVAAIEGHTARTVEDSLRTGSARGHPRRPAIGVSARHRGQSKRPRAQANPCLASSRGGGAQACRTCTDNSQPSLVRRTGRTPTGNQRHGTVPRRPRTRKQQCLSSKLPSSAVSLGPRNRSRLPALCGRACKPLSDWDQAVSMMTERCRAGSARTTLRL